MLLLLVCVESKRYILADQTEKPKNQLCRAALDTSGNHVKKESDILLGVSGRDFVAWSRVYLYMSHIRKFQSRFLYYVYRYDIVLMKYAMVTVGHVLVEECARYKGSSRYEVSFLHKSIQGHYPRLGC